MRPSRAGKYCTLLLFASQLYAQSPVGTFRSIAPELGFSIPGKHAIVQDQRGYLWFASRSGLYRYDGYNFKVYRHDPADSGSIAHDRLDYLFVDRSGDLWILTHWDGLEKFDCVTERFRHYLRRDNFTASLPLSQLQTIFQSPDGTYWIAAANGLFTFDPASGTFTAFHPDSAAGSLPMVTNISDGYEDRSGTIWVGSWGGGLDRIDRHRGVVRHYQHDASDTTSLGEDQIHSLLQTSDGMLWVGTWGGGLDRLDPATDRFTHFCYRPGASDGLGDNAILSLVQSADGTLWVGTWAGGLSWSDHADGIFHSDRQSPFQSGNFSSNDITSVFEDRNGVLWVGSWRGLASLDLRRDRTIRQVARPPVSDPRSAGFVHTLLRDRNDRLWVGTASGLEFFDMRKKIYWHLRRLPGDPSGPGDSFISSLCEDDSGTVWAGTAGGLYRIDHRGRVRAHYQNDPHDSTSLIKNDVLAVCIDRAGTVWAGTDSWTSPSSLEEVDRTTGRTRHHRQVDGDPSGFSQGDINKIIEDRSGTLWLAAGPGGLHEYDRRSGKTHHFQHDPANPASMSCQFVQTVMEDSKGRILVRSYDGTLDRYDRETGIFEHLSRNADVEDAYFSGLCEDQQGALWYSTNEGIVRLDPLTRSESVYRFSSGAEPDDALDLLHEDLPPGPSMFMGTSRGLVLVSPGGPAPVVTPPPVVIADFRIFGRPVKLDSALAGKDALTLSHSDNVISFDFAALDYADPSRNQYAYMLEGLEKEWVQAGSRHYASYTNLPPGIYVFKAKGSSSAGVWNEAGISLRIVITPPFWKTWWFTALMWIIGLGSIGATIRFLEIRNLRREMRKLEQQQALEKERVRISSDLHDELASNLTSIAMLSKVAQDGINGKTAAPVYESSRLLDRISTLSEKSVDSIRDIIWAIDPKVEGLDGLLMRVRDMLQLVCRENGIRPFVTFPPEERVPPRDLPPEFRQQLWFLLKEALNNAVKHSACTELNFCVEYNDGELKVLIQDNGHGFDSAKPGGGKGMSTMRMRAEKLGGRLEHLSAPGAGTSVTVVLHLPD